MCLMKYVEMACITGVPINYLLYGGQSIRVMSLLYYEAGKSQYVFPTGIPLFSEDDAIQYPHV